MNLTDNYDGALQKPIGTGFNAGSTAKEVIKDIDLSGKTAIVTGGASAVYGSDAVTGVVNYVLDKHFTGVKVNLSSGISNYTDAASYNAAMAAGADAWARTSGIRICSSVTSDALLF